MNVFIATANSYLSLGLSFVPTGGGVETHRSARHLTSAPFLIAVARRPPPAQSVPAKRLLT